MERESIPTVMQPAETANPCLAGAALCRLGAALAVAALLVPLATRATVVVRTQEFTVPVLALDPAWGPEAITVEQYDPSAYGGRQLQEIRFQLTAFFSNDVLGGTASWVGFENTDTEYAGTTTFSFTGISSLVSLTRPWDSTTIASATPSFDWASSVTGVYDGATDWGGTSGRITAIVATDSASHTSPAPASDLPYFIGTGDRILNVSAAAEQYSLYVTGGKTHLETIVPYIGSTVIIQYIVPEPMGLACLLSGISALALRRPSRRRV
ncbi:MAG: hypothetical protein BWZ02_03189 [Lentisphaerae bacterium ADurb.BinA184]|nr:MAG: hypothetical protein BWZ02_03189 [Lentisphaerae bacterium ADurb.BinA184]